MRKLKFDLDVQPEALLAANPEAFYSTAYLTEDVVDNYRTLPGVKSKTKLSNIVFGDILQTSTCAFTAPTDDLGATLSSLLFLCKWLKVQTVISLLLLLWTTIGMKWLTKFKVTWN